MPVFAFLDESGEFTYQKERGNHLVFVGIVTAQPCLLTSEFATLRYELLQKGHCVERFHAAEDKQFVRDEVFKLLEATDGFTIHSIIVRKNRVNPSLRKYGVYSVAYRTMLKYLVGSWKASPNMHIVVDTVPERNQQSSLKAALRQRAEEILQPAKTVYTLDHNNSSAHALLQAADYCAWAIYKKWHENDLRSYDRIAKKISNEFDIYAGGDTTYY